MLYRQVCYLRQRLEESSKQQLSSAESEVLRAWEQVTQAVGPLLVAFLAIYKYHINRRSLPMLLPLEKYA